MNPVGIRQTPLEEIRVSMSDSVETRVRAAALNFAERLKAKVIWAWKATIATSKGQALVITLLFVGVWATFGFAVSLQAAIGYAALKLAYTAYRDRGLRDIIEDQHAQIQTLNESVRRSAGQVSEQNRINQEQHEAFRELTERNNGIYRRNLELSSEMNRLQRQNEAGAFQIQDMRLQLNGAHENERNTLVLMNAMKERIAATANVAGHLQDVNQRESQAAQRVAQLERNLAAANQQIALLSSQSDLRGLYAEISQYLAQIAGYLGQEHVDQTAVQQTMVQLLPRLRRWKEHSLGIIESQIQSMSADNPARIPLISLQGYLAQENAIFGQIYPLISTHPQIAASSSSVTYLRQYLTNNVSSSTLGGHHA